MTTLAAFALLFASLEPGLEPVDPLYGRFDGDLAVAGSVGATFNARAPRVTADLRLRYLSTAGLFATFEGNPSSDPTRTFAFGAEIRPLFLARWGSGREFGHARLDLAVDSLALEFGAYVGSGTTGLQAGLGLELPVFTTASGPIISFHGGARWSESVLGGGPITGPNDRALYLMIGLGWQQLFGGRIAK